jgi:CHAD domain-containing protein
MAKAWKVKGIQPQSSYRSNAQAILAVKIQEVYSWAESIRDSDKVKELHNLRISIKRMRYSMEFLAINYGEEFQDLLKILADLQEQLGDIHDCDVVEMVPTDYLQAPPDQGDIETDAIGINPLLLRYRETRKAKYEAFLQQWDALEEADFKGQLLRIVTGESGAAAPS